MKKLSGLLLCVSLVFANTFGVAPVHFEPIHLVQKRGEFNYSYSPSLYIGSHRNGLGINADAFVWLPFFKLPLGIGVKADINATGYLSHFGLPGYSAILETGGTIMLGWGQDSEFGDSKWLEERPFRYSFAKRYTYYFDTDGTSQPFAQYIYTWNFSNKLLVINFGNDAYAAYRDGFRSAAGEVSIYVNQDEYLWGLTLGYKIWHGDYSAQISRGSHLYYDFSDIFGGDYTLGLLFATIKYNAFEMSIGYDADAIRVLLQNAVHKAMNINLVPDVDRPDRIFIEFSLFGNSGLY